MIAHKPDSLDIIDLVKKVILYLHMTSLLTSFCQELPKSVMKSVIFLEKLCAKSVELQNK